MFTREEIAEALTTLAERLDSEHIPLRIHVVGSAALVLSGFDRPATNDVDAFASNNERVFAIAKEIAQERGWSADWFSDDVKQFWPNHGDPEWHTIIERGAVAIVVAPLDLLLAMKLRAGRGRRDNEDVERLVEALGIETADQAVDVFVTYYPHDELKPSPARWLAQHFSAPADPENA